MRTVCCSQSYSVAFQFDQQTSAAGAIVVMANVVKSVRFFAKDVQLLVNGQRCIRPVIHRVHNSKNCT